MMRTRSALISLCLSAALLTSILPAHAEPVADVAAAEQTWHSAQQQAEAARTHAEQIERKLGVASDAYQEALLTSVRDEQALTEVQVQVNIAQAEADGAQVDLGRMASRIYQGGGGEMQSLAMGARMLSGQTDPADVSTHQHYLQVLGQDATSTLEDARSSAAQIKQLHTQAAQLSQSSKDTAADLATQLAQVQQMTTEAEAAFASAQELSQSAHQELLDAQAEAERVAEQARQRAATEARAVAAAQARSDAQALSSARARQRQAETDVSTATQTSARVQRSAQASAQQLPQETASAPISTGEWGQYLQRLQAAGISAPSAAQLNNRTAWDPSWQPVGTQAGIAQVPTADGPLLILAGETITAINTAFTKLGTSYLWGGTGPRYDCSGLTMTSYRAGGIAIPRTSGSQAASGQSIALANAVPGDLVFFGSPVYHVGIYLGEGMMLHAPRTGDVVKVSKLYAGPSKVIRPSLG